MARGMFWTCRYGANHDHGEKCDCRREIEQEEEKKRKYMEKLLIADEKTNQYRLNFNRERGA